MVTGEGKGIENRNEVHSCERPQVPGKMDNGEKYAIFTKIKGSKYTASETYEERVRGNMRVLEE